MGGLLEPVGPEAPRTYWIRRGVVGVVVVAVVVAVIALVANLAGAGETTAGPPPETNGPSLNPAETPGATTSTKPSSEKTTKAPESDKSSKTSESSKPGKSSKPSKSAKPSKSSKPAKPTSTKPTTTPPPPACDPGELRTTLTGPQTIEPEKKTTFTAGVINGGEETCQFTLDPESYVFRVYSGTDQIWTTKDCTKWLPEVDVVLEPEQDVTWKITWTVQRSDECELVDTKLLPGTYAANSLLTGAPPAQLVMQLK